MKYALVVVLASLVFSCKQNRETKKPAKDISEPNTEQLNEKGKGSAISQHFVADTIDFKEKGLHFTIITIPNDSAYALEATYYKKLADTSIPLRGHDIESLTYYESWLLSQSDVRKYVFRKKQSLGNSFQKWTRVSVHG